MRLKYRGLRHHGENWDEEASKTMKKRKNEFIFGCHCNLNNSVISTLLFFEIFVESQAAEK